MGGHCGSTGQASSCFFRSSWGGSLWPLTRLFTSCVQPTEPQCPLPRTRALIERMEGVEPPTSVGGHF